MARGGSQLAQAVPLSACRDEDVPSLSVDSAIWMLLIPCALLTVAAILLVGKPLGAIAFGASTSLTFWAPEMLAPEPTEQGRYLIALAAPMLLTGATIGVSRRRSRLVAGRANVIVTGIQVLTICFVIACWIGQYSPRVDIFFTTATLLTAGAIAVAIIVALRNTWFHERCERLLADSRGKRALALLTATLFTVVWLLHALNSDRSIAWANTTTHYHVQFPFDEAFAVINGLTPLADFSPQYGSLWPYLSAASMLIFGKSLLVFTITMSTITACALLAIFGVLRRVTRSPGAALLLYLPLVATSFFFVTGTLVNRHTFGSYFPAFPLRYAGPYFLAWLLARHLDRSPEARPWPLFLVAGLVMVNNTEFGIASFGATVAALLWTMPEIRPRPLLRLLANVGAGLAVALAIVAAITLVRAGSWPSIDRLFEFPRIYLKAGFALIPLPRTLGLHVIVYATYVAAIATATAQALRKDANRALTGMLVWSGVFGLGAAEYYVARSYDDALPLTFSAWALALALLTVVAVRHARERPSRLPSPASFAVLYGIGVLACSVAQTPTPWSQLDRLRSSPEGTAAQIGPYAPSTDPRTRFHFSSLADGPHRYVVRRGAPVAIFETMGHRIADAYGIRNVVPTTGYESIQTVEQFDDALDALRDAGGNTALMPVTEDSPAYRILTRRGFKVLTRSGLRTWHSGIDTQLPGGVPMAKWVDMRHIHPRALRD